MHDVDTCTGKFGIPSSKVMSLERPLPPAAFLKAAEEKAPSPRKETYRALWLPLWREP